MAQSARFTLITAVHLFLVKGDQVLLARRYQTGYEDGKYSVPAGHVDGNETITTALVREAAEEIGIVISPQNIEFAHVMHRITDRESVDFFFWCRDWHGEPKIGEPEKCDELRWVSLSGLPSNTIPYIKNALEMALTQTPYSELGWSA
ncbi:MAG TPA: NUDIX domain-containing protein [Vitreimonas sp.]|nr:NUDIX domain-containing protein [Vitreimonas sp.]